MRKLAHLLCIVGCLTAVRARAADTDGDTLDDSEESGDFDGDGTDDWQDSDDDDDLVPTLDELQRAPQGGDSDGDGNVDWLDRDDDDDGLGTRDELGSGGVSAPRNTDNDALFDYLDPDDDGDGESTATERQSAPPEPDGNQNQVPDYLDAAAFGSQAGAVINDVNVCGSARLSDAGLPVCWEEDHDGDGILSNFEGPPEFVQDNDGDGTPDFRDSDDDGDGVPTRDENPDPNHDGNPQDCRNTSGNNSDYLNPDDDDDLVVTKDERPGDRDRDTDRDGLPDHIDEDDDGDRLSTRTENDGPEGIKLDANKNGIPAYLDPDEGYFPPPEKVGPGDGGTEPIASLDAGSGQVLDDAGVNSPLDAGAGAAGSDAGRRSDSGEQEEDEEPFDPEQESMSSGKGSGCSLLAVRRDATALSVLSSLALAALLLVRRQRSTR
jgi:hypothetical protein